MNEFSWPVRVYYEDTDAGGVVYHANYLRFFERARTELLRSLGVEQDVVAREDHVIFVVHSMTIDFLKPARFNELLQVSTKVVEHKKTSFIFEQSLSREPGVLLCKAQVRIACVDDLGMKPKPIPLAILKLLTQ